MQRRKITLKLYPNAAQLARLHAWTLLHCELYNAALEERIDAYTPGTGVAARLKPLPRQRGTSKSVTRETPATTPCV